MSIVYRNDWFYFSLLGSVECEIKVDFGMENFYMELSSIAGPWKIGIGKTFEQSLIFHLKK